MEARAILRYARISPRKVSIVMDLIRNKPLDEALQSAVHPEGSLESLLEAAAANAGKQLQYGQRTPLRRRVLRLPRPDASYFRP